MYSGSNNHNGTNPSQTRAIKLTRTRVRRNDEPVERDARFAELDRLIADECERERDRQPGRDARQQAARA